MQARKADWSVRRAAARLETDDTSGAIRPRAEQVSLFARRLWLGAARRWVDLRAAKTLELYDLARPWMRLSTAGPPRSGSGRWVVVHGGGLSRPLGMGACLWSDH